MTEDPSEEGDSSMTDLTEFLRDQLDAVRAAVRRPRGIPRGMASMSNDLIIWLRAQYDDDERVARAADPAPWEVGREFGGDDARVFVREPGAFDWVGTVFAAQRSNKTRPRENAEHIARHDPARVLAEVDAKRQRIEHYLKVCEHADPAKHPAQEYVLAKGALERSLMFDALPFADRPGYRDEWRPE